MSDWRKTGDMDEYAAKWREEGNKGEPISRIPRMWVPHIAYGRARNTSTVPAVTLSATSKNAHVVLSNGNLTAATDGTTGLHFAGRATGVISSGDKRYWEITINAFSLAHDAGIGVANASETFADGDYLGSQVNGLGYYDTDGPVFLAAVAVATLAAFGAGNVIGIACIGGSKIWFRVNGGGWNNDIVANQNPATNTGGIDISSLGDVFPAYNLRNEGAPAQVTANFAGSFSFTAPSGFTGFP